MSGEIKQFIGMCDICSAFHRKQPKETLMKCLTSHGRKLEWTCSLTGVRTISFVLITLPHSGKSIPLTTLLWGRLKKLKSQFGRYGIQEMCVSDNGSQFTSTEFREFSHQWNFVPGNEFSNLSAKKWKGRSGC